MSEQPAAAATRQDLAGIADQERLAGLVQAFIEMMRAGNINRMDLEYHDLRLSLRANGSEREPFQAIGARSGRDAEPLAKPPAVGAEAVPTGRHLVTAPMIGTFYSAPGPNEPPFVQPGDHVEEGQTVGIIEAMKIMNEIATDRAGTVVEVIASNAQTVEYGSPLVLLALDGA